MERLGARIKLEHGYINASCKRLQGAEVVFPIRSVGATAQTMMAAALASGITVIKNAAVEPEITDLGRALIAGGVRVDGLETTTLAIEGVDTFAPIKHRVIPDRIETGTFAAAAIANAWTLFRSARRSSRHCAHAGRSIKSITNCS